MAARKASENDPRLLLDHQLCFALYSASLAMTKIYKPLLEPLGLTYPQYLVLLVLWEQAPMNVSAIGDRLTLDSGTLTPLLKRLEALGYVTRMRDAADERRVFVQLTAEGRKLKTRAAEIPPCLLAASHCSETELVSLTREVRAFRDKLLG